MKWDPGLSDSLVHLTDALNDLRASLQHLRNLSTAGPISSTQWTKAIKPLEDQIHALDETLQQSWRPQWEKLVTEAVGRQASQRALKIVAEIITAAGAASSRSAYYESLLKILAAELDSDKGCVLRFTDAGEAVEILAQWGFATADATSPEYAFSRTLVNELKQKGGVIRIARASDDKRYLLETSIQQTPVHAVILAPLVTADRLAGCVYLERRRGLTGYSEEEESTLKQVRAILSSLILRPMTCLNTQAADDPEVFPEIPPAGILGVNTKFKKVLEMAWQAAHSHAVVFIEGESGTGKELIARQMHRISERRDKPLVIVNCAAIPDTLLESELFGHEKGAFTGAFQTKIGRFELAHPGTIFLDEVGELPLALQAKLLRFLQFQEFERVGGIKTVKVNVRFISATSRNLKQMMAEQKFLDALYYRLNVITIKVPPLRERREDLFILTNHFVKKFAEQYHKKLKIEPEVYLLLEKYPFPGNVRELENIIHRAVVLCAGDYIGIEHLPADEFELKDRVVSLEKNPLSKFLKIEPKDVHELAAMKSAMDQIVDEYKDKLEERLYLKILEECQGNLSEAARRLGVNKGNFFRKVKRLRSEG